VGSSPSSLLVVLTEDQTQQGPPQWNWGRPNRVGIPNRVIHSIGGVGGVGYQQEESFFYKRGGGKQGGGEQGGAMCDDVIKTTTNMKLLRCNRWARIKSSKLAHISWPAMKIKY